MNREKIMGAGAAFIGGLSSFVILFLSLGLVVAATSLRKSPLFYALASEPALDSLTKITLIFTLACAAGAFSAAAKLGDKGLTFGVFFGLPGSLAATLAATQWGEGFAQVYLGPLAPLAAAVAAGLWAEKRPKEARRPAPAAAAILSHPPHDGMAALERRLSHLEQLYRKTAHEVSELHRLKPLPAPGKDILSLGQRMGRLETRLKKDEKDINKPARRADGKPQTEFKSLEHRLVELEAKLKKDEKLEGRHFHSLQKSLEGLARRVIANRTTKKKSPKAKEP